VEVKLEEKKEGSKGEIFNKVKYKEGQGLRFNISIHTYYKISEKKTTIRFVA
jgi:hypothetical protein